ncbi:MAG TPA: hypothetical protein VMZ52_07915, partial [Bryobacteraceae bacterium]|nr:hypothetical protein [Bryobacteraceae bacterium]
MRVQPGAVVLTILAAGLLFSDSKPAAPPVPAAPGSARFETTVEPVFAKTCKPCHNDRLASGGLNLIPYSAPSSLTEHRDDWEKILQKIRSGEMPPKGIPRPPAAQIETLL